MKNQRELTVKNVQANNTGILEIQSALVEVEEIGLDCTGTAFAKTMLKNYALLADGIPLQQFKTTADMENLQAYYGYTVNAGEIKTIFKRKKWRDASQAQSFNIGLADVEMLKWQFDIDPAASVDLKIQGWDMETQRSLPGMELKTANSLGVYCDIKNFAGITWSGAGEFEISDIPKDGFLMAAHLIQSADKIDKLELWIGDTCIWKMTTDRMRRILADEGRAPQAFTYHVDMMIDNELGDQVLLNGVRDYRYKLTTNGAGGCILYHETMKNWTPGAVYKAA